MAKRERATPIVHDNGFTLNGCTFHVSPKYQPLDAIGQGSYGVVCSVKNSETGEKLAIKKITPMAGDEWDATHTLREIRLMRCLGAHENIIALKDLSMCQEKDELYMMMELADTDLHRLIQSSCPLSDGHIRVIMYQILSGVKAMHDNGVLHRDLKPGNLLLNKDCELKITDFGLAWMIPKAGSKNGDAPEGDASAVISPMTEYVVTRWYRPPELMLAPNGCYDGAIDMWSVGCILGELLARKPMFPGTDFMDQLTRVFKVIPVPEPEHRGYTIDKDALKFLSSLPPAPAEALDKLCKNNSHACDLIKKLLCFNPKERLSADAALAHPFFDGVKDEWGEIASLRLDHSLEFAFETQSLPLATLRQYICEEVRAFSQQDDSLRSKRKEQLAAAKANAAAASNPTSMAAAAKAHTDTKGATASVSSAHGTSASMANDCAAGRGFTIKGCEFNVPPSYKPLQVLGEGSYGIVCAASDAVSKKNVAIKKITPMAGDEWDAKHTLREIRLMRYFGQHPNIASLQNLSTCTEKDELYIMMELVDTDLHRLIQSKTKLEEAHIAAIMYQLLCGALALHENGVLHRDLKPGNILVSRNCDVKITDFGLSRYVPQRATDGDGQQQPHHSTDRAKELMTEYVVTRWYRPPEIMLAPNGAYNEAVDMWSIGCIFGELLNRKPLFPGSDFIDQLTRVFRVLPVPSADKRGYEVEGDALAFLESLPPCSPSALTKTFRRASPEALSLLRRLLCVNPERRISARQALAHPYFKAIRAQLGDPPEFKVGRAFDFEFDYQDFPLTHLRSLIQAEVRLLQQDGARAAPSSMKRSEPTQQHAQQEQVCVHGDDKIDHPVTTSTSSKDINNPAVGDRFSDDEEDDEEEDEASSLLVESLDGGKDTATSLEGIHRREAAANAAVKEPMGPETDECESESPVNERRIQQQHQHQGNYSPVALHGHEKERAAHQSSQPQANTDSDAEDEPQEVIQVVDHSRRTAVSSSAANRLSRPKSASTSGTRQTNSHRDARDEDEQHTTATRMRPTNHHSSSSNNNGHHLNNNDLTSGNSEHSERWGHSRASLASSSTSSSRAHQPINVPSSSSAAAHSRVKTTPISARGATGGITRTSSSNQLKDTTETDKSDAVRHPERVSTHRSGESSGSSVATTTRTTPRSSAVINSSSVSSSGASSRKVAATKKETPLPEGWIKRTHSKSGREYYYDTMNKVSSWKHPSKILDNIFGTTRVPTSNRTSSSSNNNSKQSTPTSAESLTPESAASRAINTRRTSLSSTASTSSASSASSASMATSGLSASTMALPKEWARRTDPKTGRLFYVNLLTNRSFSRLPSSVTSAMLNASKQPQQPQQQHPQQSQHHVDQQGNNAAKKIIDIKKKLTVPQSPQFSQMSWQRKRVPGSFE